MTEQAPDRCRLIVISPNSADWRRSADQIASALSGGDVASLIMWPGELAENDYQRLCEQAVGAAHEANVAAVVAGDTRIAGRCGADGIHLERKADLAERLASKEANEIVGAGGAKSRHEALEIGEMRPDYMFFGRFGYDTKPEPHPRNLTLGRWWAELVEIPCVIMSGSVIESLTTVAATGAEFAAVSSAVFTGTLDPGEAVSRANALLDETAPRFGEQLC